MQSETKKNGRPTREPKAAHCPWTPPFAAHVLIVSTWPQSRVSEVLAFWVFLFGLLSFALFVYGVLSLYLFVCRLAKQKGSAQGEPKATYGGSVQRKPGAPPLGAHAFLFRFAFAAILFCLCVV